MKPDHTSTLRQAQGSARTAFKAHTKLVESPFALSSRQSGRVEGGREAQLPFLGLTVVLSKFRMDTAVVGRHLNCGFVIPAGCERGSIPLLSYLRVCELAPVVRGRGRYPSEKNSERFPITHVGNDHDGDVFPMKNI
jgi:hypothetical protein